MESAGPSRGGLRRSPPTRRSARRERTHLEVERDEIEEADEGGDHDGRVAEEAGGEERLDGEAALVDDEDDEDDAADDEERDDLVRVPPQLALVDEGERQEDAGPAGAEEDEAEGVDVERPTEGALAERARVLGLGRSATGRLEKVGRVEAELRGLRKENERSEASQGGEEERGDVHDAAPKRGCR